MFNPILAPVDGYYPNERGADGAYVWMSKDVGIIFPPNASSFGASSFQSHEGQNIGPGAQRLANFPFEGGAGSGGGGVFLGNTLNAAAATAIAVQFTNPIRTFKESVIFSWTWAAVLRHDLLPGFPVRDIFSIQNMFLGSFLYIRIQETEGSFSVTLDNGAHTLAVTPNIDGSADEGRGIRWTVTYSDEEDTLRIYQDGVEVGSTIFEMTTINVTAPINFVTGGYNKSQQAYSGTLGSHIFQGRTWTPRQVEAWAADPWGHYRPTPTRFNPFVAQPDPCDWFAGQPKQVWSAGANDGGFMTAQGQQDWEDSQGNQDWAAPGTAEWFDDKECD